MPSWVFGPGADPEPEGSLEDYPEDPSLFIRLEPEPGPPVRRRPVRPATEPVPVTWVERRAQERKALRKAQEAAQAGLRRRQQAAEQEEADRLAAEVDADHELALALNASLDAALTVVASAIQEGAEQEPEVDLEPEPTQEQQEALDTYAAEQRAVAREAAAKAVRRAELRAAAVERLPGNRTMIRASQVPLVWRKIVKAALAAGWTVYQDGRDHIALVGPDGQRTTVGSTVKRNGNAFQNYLGILRRAGVPGV